MNKTVVLVVEDDRPIRNLIVTTLKMHDYKYLTANNGVSAIMEASSHHPDIVLLDLGLPDMEGVDVIKKIRTWSNMPIIVISARSGKVKVKIHPRGVLSVRMSLPSCASIIDWQSDRPRPRLLWLSAIVLFPV